MTSISGVNNCAFIADQITLQKVTNFFLQKISFRKSESTFIKMEQNLSESQLESLLSETFDRSRRPAKDYSPLLQFFKLAIQREKRFNITQSIKDHLGSLSTAMDGLIWPLAKSCLVGFEPSMLVSPLQIPGPSISTVKPRHLSFSARSPDFPITLVVPHPPHNLKITKVPISTDRDILPQLAVLRPGNFFYCVPKAASSASQKSYLSFKIHKKTHPPKPLSNDIHTITQTGIYHIAPDKFGSFLDMKSFLRDKEALTMTANLPIIRNWLINKAFIKWNFRLRMKLLEQRRATIINSCSFGQPEFLNFLAETRVSILALLPSLHPITTKDDSFGALRANSEASIAEMRKLVDNMNASFASRLNYFCSQIRGISVLLESDFEVLNKLGALPKSLIPYSVERETNAPSLTIARLRSQLLFNERKLSLKRRAYLPKFVTVMRLFMRDYHIEQLKDTLTEFYGRFSTNSSHRIIGEVSESEGIVLNPTFDVFIEWFHKIDRDLHMISAEELVKLDSENMEEIFPGGEPQLEEGIQTEMKSALEDARTKAVQRIQDAYKEFEKAIVEPKRFLKDAIQTLNESCKVDPLNDSRGYAQKVENISLLEPKIDAIQRIIEVGPLFLDLSQAKKKTSGKANNCMEALKASGLKACLSFFDSISESRGEYLSLLSGKQSPSNSEAEANIAKKVLRDSDGFEQVAACLGNYWKSESLLSGGQIETVREVVSLVKSRHQ